MDNNTNENSDNSEFVRLVAIHDRTIRGYVRSLLPQSEYVDDVMQEVLVIAWKKFSDLRDSKDFDRWACTIAKYQVLNFRRRMARDKLVMSDDVVRMLAEEGIGDQDDRKMQLGFLEEC
ncbi:MAG: sigma factor, partial [Planctomycetota bacterium]